MFSPCGLVPRPHAADWTRDPHTSEGKPLFSQASVHQGLSFASRIEGCAEGALRFEDHCSPFLTYTLFSHLPFSLTQKGGVGRRVVDHQVAILILKKKKSSVANSIRLCFGLILMGLVRIIVSQVFNPQVTKMNTHLYNLYYFLYLWTIHSGGAGWWPYLNLDFPLVFHNSVEVGGLMW